MWRQRAKAGMIHSPFDPELKKSADRILSQVGISTAEAIRLYLEQVEPPQGLPFPVMTPSEEMFAAMREANSPSAPKRYCPFRELCEKL